MAIINGSLRTWFGGTLDADRHPLIRFIPSGVGFKGRGIYSAATHDVVSFEDGGRFTVELESTIDKRPEAWYTIQIHYFGRSGTPARVDFPDIRIRIPGNGTYEFGDVAQGISNPFMVWVSLDAPELGPGVKYWLKTNPDDVEDARNTGLLHEWSN
jgi:hypothetical protein